jgi:hypothetical protein
MIPLRMSQPKQASLVFLDSAFVWDIPLRPVRPEIDITLNEASRLMHLILSIQRCGNALILQNFIVFFNKEDEKPSMDFNFLKKRNLIILLNINCKAFSPTDY